MMTCWQYWLGLVLVTFAAANNYHGLAGHQVWTVETGIANGLVHQLQLRGLVDILGHTNSTLTMRITPQSASTVRAELQEADVSYHVQVEDLKTLIKEEKEEEESLRHLHRAESCTDTSCPAPFTFSYMSFKMMEHYLMELAKNPRVELTSIGKSVLDRDIWMVHIKSGKCKGNQTVFPVRCKMPNDLPRKTYSVWLEGGIHAREWISPAVTLHLIDKIVNECCVTQRLDFYVVPMANPDGYIYSWTTDRLWRKNRRSNPGSQCDGVDLNRNWDYQFGVGSSSDPCSNLYHGKEPFSEPETLALSNAMKRVASKGNLKMMIALHSYGQFLMYPWGWTADPAPDKDAMVEMGHLFSRRAALGYGIKYEVINSGSGLYFAAGATDDWTKGVLKTKYVYTLELRDKGKEGFRLSVLKIKPTSLEVWAGLRAVLRKLIFEK